jgi:hypothetical protein
LITIPHFAYSADPLTDSLVTILETVESSEDPDYILGYCNQVPSERNKDACYYESAKHFFDMEFCGLIDETRKKDSCFISFALNRNYDACEYITNEQLKKSCYVLKESKENVTTESTYAVVTTTNQDPTTTLVQATSITTTTYDYAQEGQSISQIYEYINQNIFDENTGVDYCNKVQKDNYKDLCFKELAIQLGDKYLCQHILNSEKKDSCFITFAIRKDGSACNFINNTELQFSCYATLDYVSEKKDEPTPKDDHFQESDKSKYSFVLFLSVIMNIFLIGGTILLIWNKAQKKKTEEKEEKKEIKKES